MEYLIYCDESLSKGLYYSDFFGGALIKSCDFEIAKAKLESRKAELNMKGEIKWVKVTENYLQKYMDIMDLFWLPVQLQFCVSKDTSFQFHHAKMTTLRKWR